jgi:hypothetical protein
LAAYDAANNVTNGILASAAGHGFVGVSACWVLCASATFQNGEVQGAVGGIGFGVFGKIAGVNSYKPQYSAPWTAGACAALDVGGCVQLTRTDSGNIGWGGGFSPGIGGFAGLMYDVITITPDGGSFLGLKW